MILQLSEMAASSAAGGYARLRMSMRSVGSETMIPGFRVPAVATGLYASIVSMPTISRFLGLVIAMYFDDHGPPHFHARHADGEAKVRIDTLEPMDSSLGRRQLRLVLAWAELHQEELLENWRLARAGETLHEIEPLR